MALVGSPSALVSGGLGSWGSPSLMLTRGRGVAEGTPPAETINLLVTNQTIYVPGDSTRNVYTPGSVDSQVFVPGDTKRKVVR